MLCDGGERSGWDCTSPASCIAAALNHPHHHSIALYFLGVLAIAFCEYCHVLSPLELIFDPLHDFPLVGFNMHSSWPFGRCAQARPRWCPPGSPRAWGRYQHSTLSTHHVHHAHLCVPVLCTTLLYQYVQVHLFANLSASYAEEGKCAPVRLAQGLKVLSVLNFVRVTVVHKRAICPQAECAHGGP